MDFQDLCGNTHDYVKFGDPSCIGFLENKQTNSSETAYPATAVGVGNDTHIPSKSSKF